MNPLVSILIPCYNAEKWLKKTLESALAQTWKNIEIIVVDDGSTDNSLAIAKSFVSSNVKVISQLNQGASAARNRALSECKGDFIQYLDADDLLSPEKIACQVKMLLNNSPGKLAICNTIHFLDGQDPTQGVVEDKDRFFFIDSDTPIDWLIRLLGGDGKGGMVHPAAWLTPRNVAESVGCWDESLSLDDDGEYFARVILASTGIRYANDVVSYYRKYKNAKSLSGASSEPHQWSSLYAIDLKAKYIFARTNSLKARRALAICYMERAVQAYPNHEKVTQAALEKINNLDVVTNVPILGGWHLELIKQIFGWKIARKASVKYHNYISFIKNKKSKFR